MRLFDAPLPNSLPFRAWYKNPVGNLQIKNIPESLHRRLRRYVKKQRCTLSDFAREAIEKELALREFHDRLARRPKTALSISAASLLEKERQQRDEDLA